ncbi:MAG TPA: hypothetical protein VL261_06705 [Nitrospira sp.]|jgi:hypothetical protein|nr:hypothetical protein [Nitrospira sp.]
MDLPHVIVEAFLGYKGEKTPRSFTLEGSTVHVEQIVDRWYSDTHSYFRVSASDGRRYVLRLELDEGYWELVMLERSEDV